MFIALSLSHLIPPHLTQASEADVVDFFRGCGVVEDYRRGATPEGKLHSWGLMQFADVAAAEKARGGAGGENDMGMAMAGDMRE